MWGQIWAIFRVAWKQIFLPVGGVDEEVGLDGDECEQDHVARELHRELAELLPLREGPLEVRLLPRHLRARRVVSVDPSVY